MCGSKQDVATPGKRVYSIGIKQTNKMIKKKIIKKKQSMQRPVSSNKQRPNFLPLLGSLDTRNITFLGWRKVLQNFRRLKKNLSYLKRVIIENGDEKKSFNSALSLVMWDCFTVALLLTYSLMDLNTSCTTCSCCCTSPPPHEPESMSDVYFCLLHRSCAQTRTHGDTKQWLRELHNQVEEKKVIRQKG